jgi:hypothetical protein
MSLLFFDGFDGYDSPTDLTNYGGWYSNNGAPTSSIVRVGTGKSMQLGNSTDRLRYVLPTDHAGKTLYIGFAVYFSNITSSIFVEIYNTFLQRHVYIQISSSGNLQVVFSDGTILSTGTTTLLASTWYYIEIKVLIANSGGIIDCVLNGASEFVFSGDTQYQTTNSVGYISFPNYGGITSVYIDDLYILNNDGSVNNTYLGEVLINRLVQTGDSSVAFTRNTGATNYEAIDDMLGAPDDATTYVYATTTGTKDEYTLSNTVSANTIYGVKVNTRAQKDDVNPKSFKNGIKTGATQQDVTHSLGIGYTNYIDIFETSDGGTTLWTPTTLDAAVSTIEVV